MFKKKSSKTGKKGPSSSNLTPTRKTSGGKSKTKVSVINIPGSTASTDAETEDTRIVQFQEDVEEEEHEILYKYIGDEDVGMIRDYINANKGKRDFSINMINKQENADPLTFAVTRTQNADVVAEILAVPGVQTRNGFLHAIKLQNLPIIEKILAYHNGDTKKAAQVPLSSKRRSQTSMEVASSSDYDECISPIVLASSEGNYDLLEFFFNKGDRIDIPHAPNCLCDFCKQMSASLHRSFERMTVIKALGNPHYIALLAGSDDDKDPIEECFNLVDKINQFAEQEPEHFDTYMEESKKVEKFAVTLLGLCHSDQEVSLLMSKRSDSTATVVLPASVTEIEKHYPRLVEALGTSKKAFITHPHSQGLLYQAWKIDKVLGMDYKTNSFGRFLTNLILVLLFPIWCIYSILDPHLIRTQFGKPLARCIYSSAVHIFFMVLLITQHSDVLSLGDRGETHIALKITIVVFEINYIISFVQHIYLACFAKAPFTGWDYFDVLNHIFFVLTFSFWLAAFLREDMPVVTRDKWSWDDPVLLSEAAMSIATTMFFLKFLRLFVLDEELGPMQAALGKMLKSVSTFAVFYFVANIAYALGFAYLYHPYTNFNYVDENGEEQTQSDAFLSIEQAMESLLWVSSAMTGPDASKVNKMPEKCHNMSNPLCANGVIAYNHHTFTEYFGTILYAFFYFLNICVLMNMLGAVMGKVCEKMLANFHTEWKFSRSEVWMTYMKDTLAPPPFTFLTIIPALIGKCVSTVHHKKTNTESSKKERQNEYRMLIKRLFQRYYRKTDRDTSEEKPVKGTVGSAMENIKDLTSRIKSK